MQDIRSFQIWVHVLVISGPKYAILEKAKTSIKSIYFHWLKKMWVVQMQNSKPQFYTPTFYLLIFETLQIDLVLSLKINLAI